MTEKAFRARKIDVAREGIQDRLRGLGNRTDHMTLAAIASLHEQLDLWRDAQRATGQRAMAEERGPAT